MLQKQTDPSTSLLRSIFDQLLHQKRMVLRSSCRPELKENNLKIAVDQKKILIPFPPPAAVSNGSHGVLASSRVSGTGWGVHRIEKTRGRNSSWVIAFIRFCGAFLEPQDTARYMGWSQNGAQIGTA